MVCVKDDVEMLEVDVNKFALVVPSGAVNAAVVPVEIVPLSRTQVVPKFSLCNAKLLPLGSTSNAGQPTVPPLAK